MVIVFLLTLYFSNSYKKYKNFSVSVHYFVFYRNKRFLACFWAEGRAACSQILIVLEDTQWIYTQVTWKYVFAKPLAAEQ